MEQNLGKMKIYIYILEQDLELLYSHLTNLKPMEEGTCIWYTNINTNRKHDWINLSLSADDFIRLKDCDILKKL